MELWNKAAEQGLVDAQYILGYCYYNGIVVPQSAEHAVVWFEKAAAQGIDVLRPSPVLCTDNGAMIASAAYYAYKAGERSGYDLDAVPALEF
jgi:TPR repeat protein